jgi:hypothetical protein
VKAGGCTISPGRASLLPENAPLRAVRSYSMAVTVLSALSTVFTIGEPFALRFDIDVRCSMSQAQHYKFQADQAKRLARQVTDTEVRERLLEMAGEYSRYAELMEARETPCEPALA